MEWILSQREIREAEQMKEDAKGISLESLSHCLDEDPSHQEAYFWTRNLSDTTKPDLSGTKSWLKTLLEKVLSERHDFIDIRKLKLPESFLLILFSNFLGSDVSTTCVFSLGIKMMITIVLYQIEFTGGFLMLY